MPRPEADLNISVTFRHTESTPALKAYVTDKITQCLRKYVSHHADVRAILWVEKRDHIVEVQMHSKGYDASAKASTDDLYSAVDKVIDALDAQLRKQKERTTQHKQSAPAPFDVG